MASTRPSPPAEREDHQRVLSRPNLVFLSIVGSLLVLCIAFAWTTRDVMGKLPFSARSNKRQPMAARTIVDLSPWQTAEALAQLAVTTEEKQYAQQAERLADHSVDQAFAAALREANLSAQKQKLSGQALAISKRVEQLQEMVVQDQAAVKQLTPAQGSTKGTQPGEDSDSTDLEIAKAQLQLDSDELDDAQEDLNRATGDERPQIRSELSAHEAEMKKYESQAQDRGQFAALSVGQYGTLAGRIRAWSRQRTRLQMLAEAQQQAEADVRTFTSRHDALEASLAKTATNSGAPDGGSRLEQIRNRSAEHQLLSIYDDRIQTEQQLASVYQKWAAQVQVQHRIVIHLILNSLAWVFGILTCMMLGVSLVRRVAQYPLLDRRQRHTLQSILELCIQIAGVGCILLVIFGLPRQTATVLGLATAALTVALQDFILAFLGWFIVIGKRGMRVGDNVEVDGVGGEVLEIGLLSTTLLETGPLQARGYPTGRRITLMNSFVIKGKYFNFSTSGQWMWDQFDIAIPSSGDTHRIAERILAAVEEETGEDARAAEREWSRARAAGLLRMQVCPTVNLHPSGSDFNLEVRYVTRASERFQKRNRLYRRVAELLQMPLSEREVERQIDADSSVSQNS